MPKASKTNSGLASKYLIFFIFLIFALLLLLTVMFFLYWRNTSSEPGQQASNELVLIDENLKDRTNYRFFGGNYFKNPQGWVQTPDRIVGEVSYANRDQNKWDAIGKISLIEANRIEVDFNKSETCKDDLSTEKVERSAGIICGNADFTLLGEVSFRPATWDPVKHPSLIEGELNDLSVGDIVTVRASADTIKNKSGEVEALYGWQ